MKASLNYYQTILVGKVKTDVVQFTSIQSAVDGITDNAAGKRYAIYVHPGVYTEKVIMEDYIDLIAMGGREETVITFASTVANEATLTGENSLIKGFTIVTDSTGFIGRCIQNAIAGFEVEDCILSVTAPAGTELVFNTTQDCAVRGCQIDTAGGGAAGLTVAGAVTVTVDGTIINSATDAIQVTAAGTLTLTDCNVQNLIDQDAGTVNILRSRVEEVVMGTATCTLTAELTRFTSTFATADVFAHTITCHKCTFGGQNFNNAATGATTIVLRGCDGIATLTNAGVAGTVTLYECGVETLTTTQGTVVAYGGRINACGGSTGTRFVWWENTSSLKVLPTMVIADALALASSGDIVHLTKGSWAESALTAASGVDIVGEGSNISIIETTNNAVPIITVGNNVSCNFKGVRISNLGTGTTVAIAANAAAASLTAENCEFRGNVGASIVTATTVALGVGASSFTAHSCIFRTGANAIAVTGAVAATVIVADSIFATCTLVFSTTGANHTFAFDFCDFGAGGVTLTANVPVVTLANCEDIGTFTHSTASTVTLNHCRLSGTYTTGAVAAIVNAYLTILGSFVHNGSGDLTFTNCQLALMNNTSTAAVTIIGGTLINLVQGATAGTITVSNCAITNDISTGATGTIRLKGQCTFESISANDGVLTWKVDPNHIKVVAGEANMKIANALTLAASGDVIEVYPGTYAESNLTLKAGVNLVGTDPDQCVIAVADAAQAILNAGFTCSISNLTVTNGNAAQAAIKVTANTLTLRNCVVAGTGAGDAIQMIAGTLNAYDTTIGAGDIDLSTAICTLSMYRCRITTDPLDTAGAFAHVLTIENTDFGGQNLASAATGATTLAMRGCTNVGTVSNLGTGTFAIQNSALTGVTANNALAIIRLKNCQYRVVTRTTGNIVDESPECKTSIFHVLKRSWDALIANANVATRVAVGGAVASGGSGQCRLRINDNAADAAGVENAADAAGSLDSSWTPARTPRYCMQISVGAFRATTTMFFGLRATLGAAVPGLAEDHAGFIWTGAVFNARSSDGGGVGQTTPLVTPSTGAQHQLEGITFGGVSVEFYVDGVLVATHTGVGVPDIALDFQEYEISNAGGGATTSDITLREGFLMECTS